jgi:hypothetical protein
MKLTALAVVTLVLGISAGFALRGSVFEAEAKPPPELRALVAEEKEAMKPSPLRRTAYNWATT